MSNEMAENIIMFKGVVEEAAIGATWLCTEDYPLVVGSFWPRKDVVKPIFPKEQSPFTSAVARSRRRRWPTVKHRCHVLARPDRGHSLCSLPSRRPWEYAWRSSRSTSGQEDQLSTEPTSRVDLPYQWVLGSSILLLNPRRACQYAVTRANN